VHQFGLQWVERQPDVTFEMSLVFRDRVTALGVIPSLVALLAEGQAVSEAAADAERERRRTGQRRERGREDFLLGIESDAGAAATAALLALAHKDEGNKAAVLQELALQVGAPGLRGLAAGCMHVEGAVCGNAMLLHACALACSSRRWLQW